MLIQRVGVPNPEQFPHYYQGNTPFPLTRCFPSAASNLIEFYKHSFPNLKARPQKRIEEELARYFQTDRYENGTSMQNFLAGVEKFLIQHGITCTKLRYEGPLTVSERYRDPGNKSLRPDLGHIKESLRKHEPLIASIGWYYYNPQTKGYQREGSHAVTVVGIEKPLWRLGQSTLLVRDPLIREDNYWNEPLLTRLPLKQITAPQTKLVTRVEKPEISNFPINANGYYRIQKKFPLKPVGTVGILESVVHVGGLLETSNPNPSRMP